jgi:pilus assembly protein FimV
MTHRSTWRLGALAGAIALLGSLVTTPAYALGLGRITVQSALGEALKAEIDVPEISAEEAASLRVAVAGPVAFKAAGLEYTAAVAGVQVNLLKRADGRSYLSLTSSKPVTEPFVDLILEASWASGRVVRDYTRLFDPPSLRQAAPSANITPTAPVFSRPAPTSSPSFPTSPPPVASTAPRQAPAARPSPPSPPAAAPKTDVAAAPKPASSGQQVTVKAGDTAGKIAAQSKPASISLDQMLVALLKSNPDAFIGGNINRLKSGAVLDIPSAEDAAAVPPGEASRTIIAQSKDFNDFRQKLASGVPATQVESANRQAGGKVQAKVEDRAATAATPDKLTLSKGALQGKASAEEKIAKDKQAKDASTRVAELAKNIGDLNKIAGTAPAAVGSAAAASSAKSPAMPALTVPAVAGAAALPAAATPAVTPAIASASKPASAPVSVATAPALAASPASIISAVTTTVAVPATPTSAVVASSPVAVVSAPVVAAPAASAPTVVSPPVAIKKPVVVAPPPPEPSLIDELTDNPLVLPGLGALLALLAGFGFYRFKKRDNPASVDSSFLESRLQPDSFFGASGGQRIDTSEGSSATGSSMVYSPSQLDAAGDVDPVAEADVYLAYGRDLQAEEILKEALRTNPSRVAIHAKLMEIYAKRRDVKSFEMIAGEAFTLTRGNGPEWAYICELGRDLDPGNPMYQPGGEPQQANSAGKANAAVTAAAFGGATMPQMMVPTQQNNDAAVDFDLDLDFSAGDAPSFAAPPPPAIAPIQPVYVPEPTVSMQAAVPDPIFDGLDMDFSPSPMPSVAATVAAPATDNSLSFSVDPLPIVSKPAPVAAAPAAPAAALDNGMLEFDLGSLSLDLDGPITESPTLTKVAPVAPVAPAISDPMETKFALAEEFRALGDSDGARSLASEVVAQAQGALKTKAQAFLNALS